MIAGVNIDRDAMGYARAIGDLNAVHVLLPGL